MSDIKIGDKVRSFDFVTRDLQGFRACYVEGVVEDVGRFPDFPEPRYKIRVERRVFGGMPVFSQIGDFVYPPLNGLINSMTGTKTECVVKLELQ